MRRFIAMGEYFDKYQTFIIVGIAIVTIAYMFTLLKTSSLGRMVGAIADEATNSTKFNAAYFEIYDKSTDSYCDRLISVRPFNWILVAKGGQLYALTDVQHKCPPATARAVKLHANQDKFKYVCLSSTKIQLLELYRTSARKSVRINFDVEDLQSDPLRFTVLDACNYLFEHGYIALEMNADALSADDNSEIPETETATDSADDEIEPDAETHLLSSAYNLVMRPRTHSPEAARLETELKSEAHRSKRNADEPEMIRDPVTGIVRRKVTRLPREPEIVTSGYPTQPDENLDHVVLPKDFVLPPNMSLAKAKRLQQTINYYRDNPGARHQYSADEDYMTEGERRAMDDALAAHYRRTHDPSKKPKYGPGSQD